MIEIETTGRTIDEAIQKALDTLGVKRNNLDIKVLSEAAQGLFNLIGAKDARINAKVLFPPAQYLEHFLAELIKYMNLEGTVAVEEDEEKIIASINGKRIGSLIGRRGRTLNELQYLLNTIIKRQFSGIKKMIIVDVEGYRERREKTLTQLAKSIARKVDRLGEEQVLEPMTPQERRIIHLALKGDNNVITYSKGEEPYRKVVIAPR